VSNTSSRPRIPNTNDGSSAPPRLRVYLNLMALEDVEGSSAPRTTDPETLFAAIRDAGYEGVQFIAPLTQEQDRACRAAGLGRMGLGRLNEPEEAAELAARLAGEGQECGTLHVGWGIEDDAEACRLFDAILEASARYRIPLYLETHRATILQDMWRTVQFVKRYPELRFNGDFSHWYTGQEMVYGGFDNKLAFIQPVLERVRFVHARIGNPGCIQVNIEDGDPQRHPYVAHFRQLWTAAFEGFLASAGPGDYLAFVPELLAPRIFYARAFPGADGELQEECDRWQQALVLKRIGEECFAAAREQRRSPAADGHSPAGR
jgi:sugar phosphate isomerase/epimerase